MKYLVATRGYHNGPEFNTKKEAKDFLNQIISEEKKRCKNKFGAAHVHRSVSGDSVDITLGADNRSSLWSSHCIIDL